MNARLLLLVNVFLTSVASVELAWAAPEIELNAVLGKQVIATVDGAQVKLKIGESTPEGLKLIAVTRKLATFEWEGEKIDIAPSSRIGAQFTDKPKKSITITRDSGGHYLVKGEINGHPVNFVVDTGASDVSMTQKHADAMGLEWQKGRTAMYSTANGNIKSYVVSLEKVTIGGITVNLVDASVTPNTQDIPILLGMSFLKHFEMSESNNVLTLTRKY